MRTRTLLTQVLAVNTALVAGTAIVPAIIARGLFEDVFSLQRMLLLGLAVASAVLLNSLLLRRRLRPLERLLHTMERVALSVPRASASCPRWREPPGPAPASAPPRPPARPPKSSA